MGPRTRLPGDDFRQSELHSGADWDGRDRRAPLEPTESWHLDKKVPLSLIFAMLVQAGIVVWAIADIKKDVEILKVQIVAQAAKDTAIERSVETLLATLTSRIDRLDGKLDRALENRK